MEKVAKIIATYFGLGLSSKAPGTVGSLGTLPLVAAAAYFYGTAGILLLAFAAFFIGVWATHQLIKNQVNKDPSMVVIDEVAGQSLTFALVKLSYRQLELMVCLSYRFCAVPFV